MFSSSDTPDPAARERIERTAHADVHLCWTCSTCDSECPIFRATGRLRPQKMVRMASLGFLEDAVALPEIWYCLTCKRCNQTCPNRVKPAAVIRFLRQESVRRDPSLRERFSLYRDLFARLQRARWHAAARCLDGETPEISHALWQQWLDTPVEGNREEIALRDISPSIDFKEAAGASCTTACFNCSECSNTCPICFERAVFDPQWIIRMVIMGLEHEVLASPSIWLCIGCERCTDACGEKVDGRLIIQRLQELALKKGVVDRGFLFRWKGTQETMYHLFTEEIDRLMRVSVETQHR